MSPFKHIDANNFIIIFCFILFINIFFSAALMFIAARIFSDNLKDLFGASPPFGLSYIMVFVSVAFCFFSGVAIILVNKYCYNRCCETSESE